MAGLRDFFKSPGPSYGAEVAAGRQGNRPIRGIKTGGGQSVLQRFGTDSPATAPVSPANYPVGGGRGGPVSGEARTAARLRAGVGADVVTKPFNPEELTGEDLGEAPLEFEAPGITVEQEYTGDLNNNPTFGNVTVDDLKFINWWRSMSGQPPIGEVNQPLAPERSLAAPAPQPRPEVDPRSMAPMVKGLRSFGRY